DGIALALADLGNQVRARSKDALCVDCDRAIGRKAIAAAVECAKRIEFAHLRFEFGELIGARIWGVGNYEIEAGCQSRAKIASNKCSARCYALTTCIFPRDSKGRRIAVSADRVRVRQFGQERNQNDTRADAEIGDAQSV